MFTHPTKNNLNQKRKIEKQFDQMQDSHGSLKTISVLCDKKLNHRDKGVLGARHGSGVTIYNVPYFHRAIFE
jgi:hypothetical protein